MCSSKFFRKLLAAFILAAGLALTSTSLALAHSGPVSDPPGGVTLTETGDCTGGPNYDVIGECQGRTGGLNLTYTGFGFTQFQDLYWGPAFLGDVRLRLGGHDWFGYLSYRAEDSNLENGVAVWRGNTDIPISNGSGFNYTYVDTRFTLVVTDLDGNPLRIEEPGSIEGLIASGPMLHITSDLSGFKANILFEFNYGGTWVKALEGYDSLHTPPAEGQVLSSYQPSFFYTDVPLDGLSATNDSPTPFGSTTILTATVLTGTNPTYTWDFGDGTLGSGAVTGHIFTGTGTFTALVSATNEANVITTTTMVTITETPVAGLSASNDSPTRLGDVTTLQASVTGGSNITYAWALGDGTYETGQAVAHTYPSAGYYTAWVTATNVFNQLTATTTVTVPFEVFLTDPAANHPSAAPEAPLNVTFTGDVAPGTISTATLAVSGAFTGFHGGSFSFPDPRQVVFSPSTGFLPGELVTVQVLTDVQSTAGQPLNAPYQWQFYATAPTGSGYFINSSQVLTAAHSLGGSLGDLDGDGDLDVLQANYGEDNVVWINDGKGLFTAIVQDLGSEFNVDTALGDLDGDGDLDAFFAKLGPADEVWLNDGSGTFTNSGQTLGATSSVDVILGDLDNDGDLDAYVATYNGASDQIWLNDGSGTFANSGQDLGSRPSMAAALGDLDGDSDLDAYVLYLNQPNKVWLNDGQSQFSDSGQDLGSLPAQEVDLGDLDGDGDLDAFIAAYDQPCQVWLNDGQGGFSNSGQALGSFTSMSIDLGDVDADGDLDAFVANLSQPEVVWLNDGQGLFTSHGQGLGSGSSRQAMLGDLDGDGDLDAFVAASDEPSQVWFNQVGVEDTTPPPGSHAAAPGSNLDVRLSGPISSTTVTTHTFWVHGRFQGPLGGIFTTTLASSPPVVAFDPQGPLLPGERVQATFSSQVLDENGSPVHPYVWEFRAAVAGGSGNFTNSGQSLSSPSGWRVALGDLDSDGDLDAIQADYSGNSSQVWLNDGVGIYTSSQTLATTRATDVALGDLDADGDLDVLVAQMDQPLMVWLNDGSGHFTDTSQPLGTLESYAVNLGDLDGDGDLDAFVATYNPQPDRIFFNDGSGVFSDSMQTLGTEYAVGAALGDIDNDGDLDAYVANCHGSGNDKLWLNDGQGQFSDSGQTIDGLCSYEADFGDVDGDGDLDVVVANGAAGGQPNQLYINDGHGTLSNSGQNLGSYQNTAIELGDIDADGDLDLFYTTTDAGQHIWRNDGSGTFTDTQQVLGEAYARGLALGDLDGDGDLDVFVSADEDPSEIWLNENSADLALAKSVSPVLPQPGGWITYTLDFTNLGPQTATEVQIVDQVPVSLTMGSLSVSSNLPITSTGGPSFTWLLPDLPPGAGGTITITGQLSDTLPGGHTFTNTASLSASEWDFTPSNNQGQAALTTNQAPLAAAGPDQNVDTGDLVTLDGRASLDPDGNLPLTYLWVQTSGPTISFSSALSLTTFSAPEDPVLLNFVLIVTDSLGQSSLPNPVAVTVHNQPPVADAGTDQTVDTLALVTLDGSGSDPDDDLPFLYLWTQIAGDPVSLSDPATAGPTFTAPDDPGMLTFTLIVTDSWGLASVSDEVVITVTNQAPLADAGPDQTVDTLALVTLDGSASDDPDNDALTYQWAQTGSPLVTLSDPSAVTPTFTAPADPAVLTFTLIVTDSWGLASAPDEVVITVKNQAP
ncbi:MAG TPA: FG-GAP-like repeat-containing protein, partial [Anaerolineales bacterium]|nr:FG-GAP-like repeat-containing protein [Anaerolineales bacterium]